MNTVLTASERTQNMHRTFEQVWLGLNPILLTLSKNIVCNIMNIFTQFYFFLKDDFILQKKNMKVDTSRFRMFRK